MIVLNSIVCFQWTLGKQKHLKHLGFFGAMWEALENEVNFT